MGGSGGSSSGRPRSDPAAILAKLAEAQSATDRASYESGVNAALDSYLLTFNDRDREAVARHLNAIEKALGKELDGIVDLKYGGSVAKHTFVDGLSDVDCLALLDNCELADQTPAEARAYLAMRLGQRFPNSTVEEGTLAVTIHFSDIDVQVLPAVSCRSHVKIADASGEGWAAIKPREFSSVLTQVNQNNAGRVVPIIKLAKGIIGNLPESQRISGYHAESLAVEVFRNYTGELSNKAMLRHFFDQASERVLRPIVDRTGQSVHTDDSLGPAQSAERRVIGDAFSRVARRMQNADLSRSLDPWNTILGE